MRLCAPLALLIVAGCSGGAGKPPAVNNSFAMQDDGPPADLPGPAGPAGPCVGPLSPDALANCDFGPRERMRGIWVTGFERSDYVPGGTGARAAGDPGPPRRWLTFAPGAYPDPALRAELDALRATAAVDIEFEGRVARPPGAVVVVDRIISARSLGPVPRGE